MKRGKNQQEIPVLSENIYFRTVVPVFDSSVIDCNIPILSSLESSLHCTGKIEISIVFKTC